MTLACCGALENFGVIIIVIIEKELALKNSESDNPQ